MARCDRCGKGVLVGMNVSHSHVRTKKRSYPNLHTFRLKTGGVTRRLRLCTKCLRIVKKTASPDNPPATGVAFGRVSRGGRATAEAQKKPEPQKTETTETLNKEEVLKEIAQTPQA